MSLSRIEQETIILFNEADKTAIVDTCNTALINRMDKYCAEDKLCCLVKKDKYGAKYVCPKSWVKVQRPRQLSEEQKREFAVRARHNFGWEYKSKDPALEWIKAGKGLPPIESLPADSPGIYRGDKHV